MEIIRAPVLGFCFGVRRAVEFADKACAGNNGLKKLYSLGPLIHNPSVLEDFSNRGIEVLQEKDVDKIQKDSIVIIRAHGTTPKILKILQDRQVQVLDATCPKVLLSQKKVREWSERGYKIFLAGDKNHGEVTGICGCSKTEVVVIEDESQAASLDIPEKSFLLAQTTFSRDSFLKIQAVIRQKNPDVEIFDSICSATMERQNALLQLKGRAQGILVIGGKNSSNTKHLYETARTLFDNSALIENAQEIPAAFFDMDSVAITAGASTPDFIINQVESHLGSELKAL